MPLTGRHLLGGRCHGRSSYHGVRPVLTGECPEAEGGVLNPTVAIRVRLPLPKRGIGRPARPDDRVPLELHAHRARHRTAAGGDGAVGSAMWVAAAVN